MLTGKLFFSFTYFSPVNNRFLLVSIRFAVMSWLGLRFAHPTCQSTANKKYQETNGSDGSLWFWNSRNFYRCQRRFNLCRSKRILKSRGTQIKIANWLLTGKDWFFVIHFICQSVSNRPGLPKVCYYLLFLYFGKPAQEEISFYFIFLFIHFS